MKNIIDNIYVIPAEKEDLKRVLLRNKNAWRRIHRHAKKNKVVFTEGRIVSVPRGTSIFSIRPERGEYWSNETLSWEHLPVLARKED